jgi:hypothetical protein
MVATGSGSSGARICNSAPGMPFLAKTPFSVATNSGNASVSP